MATQSGPLSAEVAALLHDLKAFGAFSEEAYDVIWGAVEVREDGCISHDDAHVVFRLAGMTRKQASALICAVRDEAGQIFIENIAALAGTGTSSAACARHGGVAVNGNASRSARARGLSNPRSKSKAQLQKRLRRRQRRQQREEGWLNTHTFSARFGTTHDQNTRFLERKRKLCA